MHIPILYLYLCNSGHYYISSGFSSGIIEIRLLLSLWRFRYLTNSFNLPAIKSIKQNLEHSPWIGFSPSKIFASYRSLKMFVKLLATILRRRHHKASMLWLEVFLPWMKLFIASSLLFVLLLKYIWSPFTITFSVPNFDLAQ